jgi:VanZ family protein
VTLQGKVYRYIFWIGYFAVLITTFIPVAGELNKINIGTEAFHIRLDHILHLTVYFLICMYFLFGQLKGITLFDKNSLLNFLVLILLLATVTEVVQLWVPERTFNVFDLLSNMVGAGIGMGVVRIAQLRQDLTT